MKPLLENAENRSGKGTRDWHSTKDVAIRVRYIEEVLDLSPLVGRIFFGGEPSIPTSDYWQTRVNILAAAVSRYTHGGRCHHEVAHEGLKLQPRLQLHRALKARGLKRITVESALVATDLEIRCADALAGFIRSKLFDEGTSS